MPAPENEVWVVEEMAAAFPQEFALANKEGPKKYDFVNLVAQELHENVDILYGLNRKENGEISGDAINYKGGDSELPSGNYIIDIIAGSTGTSPEPHWLDVTDDTFDAGSDGTWVMPGEGAPPAPLPPPPPPVEPPITIEVDVLDMDLSDLVLWERTQPVIDMAIDDWYAQTHGGHFPGVTDRAFLRYRIGPEYSRWERFVGPPMTLRKVLQATWPMETPQPPPSVAPSYLDFGPEHWRSNFRHPIRQYFGPHAWVQSEDALRERFQWLVGHGYTCDLAMLEQDHWGPHLGNPLYTMPDPNTPKVRTGGDWDGYGWTYDTDELIRRINIARNEYGLEVVLSLWEQQRIKYDLQTAMDETRRIAAALDDHVLAVQVSWELNEVLDRAHRDELTGVVAGWFSKPVGRHFAAPEPGEAGSVGDKILWHQSSNDLDNVRLDMDIQRTMRMNPDVTVVAHEHSPAIRQDPVYTVEESKERGDICVAAGAYGSLDG